MAEYKIVVDGLRAFGVEVMAPGAFRSMRDFPTELAAQEWIDEHQYTAAIQDRAALIEELRLRSLQLFAEAAAIRKVAVATRQQSAACRARSQRALARSAAAYGAQRRSA